MYRILMEDDYKPSIEQQKRLKSKMHDVVKKEILKIVKVGIIYPISDSKWLSPANVVHNKRE